MTIDDHHSGEGGSGCGSCRGGEHPRRGGRPYPAEGHRRELEHWSNNLTCRQMCTTEKIEGDCQPPGEQDFHVCGRPEKEVSFMWMMMTVLTMKMTILMYKKGS